MSSRLEYRSGGETCSDSDSDKEVELWAREKLK